MRILIAGDIHGDSAQVKYLIGQCEKQGIDTIVSVGDFGYWPHIRPGFIAQTQRRLAKAGIHLYWIDGNHENFDHLFDNQEFDDDGFGIMHPVYHEGEKTLPVNIHYIPRGHRWEWDGCRFMGFGGAPSIDKAYRTYDGPGMPQNSWWPQEIPSREDEGRVFEGPENCADVLLLHDSPRFPNGLQDGYKNDAISEYNRKLMAAVVDHVNPDTVYHGHYHIRWEGWYKGIRLIGLDRDGSYKNSFAILDTEVYSRKMEVAGS